MGKGRKNIVWFRVIIMDVKRIIIDIDSSLDIKGGTALPESLIKKKNVLPAETQDTGTPEQQEDYRKLEALEKGQNEFQKAKNIGHTYSDLVLILIDQPQFVVTALTILSFLISISKIKNPQDLWLPIVISVILNSLWFIIPKIKHSIDWLKKK